MSNDPSTTAFLEWYGKLWDSDGGEAEKAVAKAEKRLKHRLPALLRAVYRETSLRESQMLHLFDLDDLLVEDDVLVFAREQQACWFWGIPVARLGESNPMLVANPNRKWEDDGCTLEDWLRFFALTNRPYEPPCIDQSSFAQERLKGAWQLHRVKWRTLQHALWTNGEAVLEEGDGNLGARDEDALRRAAESLGIDDEEVDAAIEEFGT